MKQSVEIELDMIKSRLDSLEANEKWLMSNWVEWTKRTKDIGGQIVAALAEKIRDDTASN